MNQFLRICNEINFLVSLEKTFWGTTLLVFLGFLLDTVNRRIGIPVEKIAKALDMIENFLTRKKVTIHIVQKLCGHLNFLCHAIVPGRVFTRRLYAMTACGNNTVLKPHHHVRVKLENKLDLQVWKNFLTRSQVYCKPFIDFGVDNATEIRMYSDTSRNFVKGGFGAWCGDSWLQGFWDTKLVLRIQPSIEYLELFAVTTAVLAWIHRFKSYRVIKLFCDNESVCHMIIASSSSCKHCMILIRLIVMTGLNYNIQIKAKHMRTKMNGRADALSRGQFSCFWRISPPSTDYVKTSIPEEIWPMNKLWPEN